MPSRRLIALSIGVCLAGGLQAQTARIDFHKIDNEPIPPSSYWTEERMEEAEPMPLPWSGRQTAGAPVSDNDCEIPKGLLFLTELSKHPYASAGRLFFTIVTPTGSKDRFCTAEITGSNRTLLTAAHCVRSLSGVWYTRFFFKQGYDGKKRPGVDVELELVATWQKYVTSGGETAFDYAFFRTRNFSSRSWLRLGTPDTHPFWIALGYAENSEYHGERLVQIMGPKGPVDKAGGTIQMLGNPMENGSSGGAWIANASLCPASCSEAVGLTASRSFENCEAISPLFNDETRDLMEAVRRSLGR